MLTFFFSCFIFITSEVCMGLSVNMLWFILPAFFFLQCTVLLLTFSPLLFLHFMVDRMLFSVMRWCPVSVIDEVGWGGKRKSRTSGDLSLSLISADFLISSFLFFHCHVFEEHPSLLICLGLRSWATSRPSLPPFHCPAQHLLSIWWTLCPGTVLTIFMLSVELSGGYLLLCAFPMWSFPSLLLPSSTHSQGQWELFGI